MTPSKDLFELIKSLDKAEKTFFKKFSRHNPEESKFELLFNTINAQREYDEEAIIKKFKGKLFANQFPVAKNYLFNTILKSLRALHKNQHSEVRNLLLNAEIFYEKGFLKQSRKAILKAKKIAQKNELHLAMPELLRMEEKISVDLDDMDHLESIIPEKTAALSIQGNAEAYRDINFKILSLYRKYGKAREKKQLEEMKLICGNKLMQHESLALSFEAKCRFHEAWSLYFYAAGNKPGALKHLEKIIEIYRKDPEIISNNFRQYIVYFGNLTLTALEIKKYKKTGEYLAILEKEARFAKTQIQKASFYYQYNLLLLGYLNDTGMFLKATDLIPSIAGDLEKYARNLNEWQKAVILINISHSYFGAEQYDKCISWINRIRNEINFTSQPDFQNFCNIFYLIVNFEAGKYELLPYLIKSLYRILSKKEQLYKFEAVILSFLRNDMPKINTKSELSHAFLKLKMKLVPLQKDPNEKNAFSFFDYISWLETRIEKKSFEEIVRRKAIP